MEFIYSVNLIFIVERIVLFLRNMFEFLVIVSFWRSVLFQMKLCYFTMMVLSYCDLLVVLTSHPLTVLAAMSWLTKKVNVYPEWLVMSNVLLSISVGTFLFALFVINFDRYLTTRYPIFHRTSVTKGKLLTLFIFLIIFGITVAAMSINDVVIPHQVGVLIFCIISTSPMFLINYRLFTIARKSRRNNEISRKLKKSFSLKNILNFLLVYVVACLMALSIPTFVYVVLRLISKEKEFTMDNAELAAFWARTADSINSTFNC